MFRIADPLWGESTPLLLFISSCLKLISLIAIIGHNIVENSTPGVSGLMIACNPEILSKLTSTIQAGF